MDIQKFINNLSTINGKLNLNFLKDQDEHNSNFLNFLNLAVGCLNPDEIYCEIGCQNGLNLIGALLNNQDNIAYGVDELNEEQFNQLIENLTQFNLEEQVFFCNQNFEEFFADLKSIQSDLKIGVYFYTGKSDYRSVIMGLLLVKEFLADQALIVVNNSNHPAPQQAIYDFINSDKFCNFFTDLPQIFDNLIILTHNLNQNIQYSWQEIEDKLRNSLIIQALNSLHLNLESQEKLTIIKTLITEGVKLFNQGKYEEAIAKNKEVLFLDKYNPEIDNYIALIYLKQEQYQEALHYAQIAVTLEGNNITYLVNLATILEKLGQKLEAIKIYQQALLLDSNYLEIYLRLGKLLTKTNQLQEAKLIYQKIIELDPLNVDTYINWGDLLVQEKQYSQAIEQYQKALVFRPKNPQLLEKIALALDNDRQNLLALLYHGYQNYYQEKYETAIKYFADLLTQTNAPQELKYYIIFADCYRKLGQEKQSREIYQKALKYYPQNNYLYLSFIALFKEYRCTQDDRALIEQFIEESPDNLALKIESQRILPIIYESEEEINLYRQKFEQFIDYLEQLIKTDSLLIPANLDSVFSSINGFTNFYLQYQYQDDKNLQQRYGKFINYVMKLKYPNYDQSLPIPPLTKEGKIKIGYLSMAINFHTVSKLIKGWFKYYNKQQFEIYCYYGDLTFDQVTNEIKSYCDRFYYIPNNLEKIIQQIYQDQLHILVFIEIGMSPMMTMISALRLAPIQCTTWCHPITSGSPNVDYFLSSELMEPNNAQVYYTERLIKLPNLGIYYEKPALPEKRKSRTDFNLKDDKIIYLCCQSLFKYLPQYDYLFAEIALRVPASQFVFLTSKRIDRYLTETFINRLKKVFANLGLNSENYCLFLPQLKPDDYFNLNLISDLFLDSLGWSGGNTTLEALACNLPVVTYPGKFMRSRHSYAILKMLKVEELIANNEQEYVNIAVKLGLDHDFRNTIKNKIASNLDLIYNDYGCIRGLENFYQKVIQKTLTIF